MAGRVYRLHMPAPAPVGSEAAVERVAVVPEARHLNLAGQLPSREGMRENGDPVTPCDGSRRANVVGVVVRQDDGGGGPACPGLLVEDGEELFLLRGVGRARVDQVDGAGADQVSVRVGGGR